METDAIERRRSLMHFRSSISVEFSGNASCWEVTLRIYLPLFFFIWLTAACNFIAGVFGLYLRCQWQHLSRFSQIRYGLLKFGED